MKKPSKTKHFLGAETALAVPTSASSRENYIDTCISEKSNHFVIVGDGPAKGRKISQGAGARRACKRF